MAHNEQRDFCRSVKQILPSYFNNTMVLDIGSLDINGSNQFLFDDCLYIGVDVAEGRNVDLITTGHQLMLPDASVDVIISTECFEHDQFYDKTIKNIFRMLKPGGLFLFTCATTGRPEHGTRRTSPQDAPLLQGLGDWSDYYKNLTESDIREVLDVDVLFSKYAFSIHDGTHDLYFYGVKSGAFIGRNNYSFLVSEKKQQIQNILNERTGQITSLNETLNERTSQITSLNEILNQRTGQIISLNETLNECTGQITSLNETLSERTGQITSLNETLSERTGQITSLNETLSERTGQITSLNETLNERTGQITSLNETLNERTEQITSLSAELQAVRQLVSVMEGTISWRVTKPLRVFRHLLSLLILSFGRLKSTMSFLRQHPREFGHFGVLLKKHGLIEALKRTASFIKRGGPRPISAAPIVHAFVLRAIDKPIVILTTFHCDYVAVSILTALKKIGISSKIIYERPIEGFEDVPHFVICPQMFSQLPGLYVSFQMEQSVSSRWFTDDYIRKLENSFAIFDYSTVNIAFLQQKGLSRKQIYFLPIDYVTNYKSTREDADCDVIFYGDINNERRKMFISELKKHCTVKVINNLFGDELYAELAKARVIVNIHYYSGALLETTRIWECLSLNKLVVSERSSDMDQHANLEQFIDFVEIDDVSGMVERVKYWLNHDELRHQYISNNKSKLEQQPNQFEYFFYRFLLATDNIGFDDFWSVAGHKVILPSDKVCLHLPEDVVRTTDFSNDNHYDFSFFAGLRHTQGWIGCAMSYKFMIMLARQQGLSKVTICEDDVEFPPDFASKWQEIQRYLDDRVLDWDVFSGLLAHLSDEANVSNVHSTHVLQYVTIDRLISMVFNVYNRQMYDVIAQWDSTNHDVQTNTIDRYLEAYKLKIITTSPFLVGHKEDLQSTIWGFQNTQYRDLIANSSKLLKAKILEHEK